MHALLLLAIVAAQDTLPAIVVTATRTPLPREAVTASVTVLDGAALRARGLFSVADALRDLPGAAVVRSGTFGAQTALFLRGGESNFTQVLLDGVPLNVPGGAFDFATLSLAGVERIEILRGPASVLYGSDAVSGVVHVITRAGGGGRGAGSVRAGAGTYGTLGIQASAGDAAGPLRWRATGSRHATDGIHPFNSAFEHLTGGIRLGLEHRLGSVDLTARYSDGTLHFPTDGAGNLVDTNQFQRTETMTVGLELARRLTPAAEARIHLALNRVDGRLDDQPDGPADTVGAFLGSTTRRTLTRTADARLNLTIGPALITVGGVAEGEAERAASMFVSTAGAFTSTFDATRTNLAGYTQATGQFGSLAWSAGARLDGNQRFGTFVTVRGGAALRLAPSSRLRASAGTGFKEPTFFENFGGGFVVGNPDLAPERSTSWEAGVEQRLADGRVTLEVTGFLQRFRDLIEFTSGDPNYVNVSAARADGLELAAVVRLPSPVSRLSLAYTWLSTAVTAAGDDPTFRVGGALVRRPAHAAVARLTVSPHPRVTLTGGVRYTGTRIDLDYSAVDFVTVFEPQRVTLPVHALVDLSAAWRIAPWVALEGAVANLLDHAYEEVLGFAAPGRAIRVGGRIGG